MPSAARDEAFFNRMDGSASEKARERAAAVKKNHETHGVEHNRAECKATPSGLRPDYTHKSRAKKLRSKAHPVDRKPTSRRKVWNATRRESRRNRKKTRAR